MIDQINTIILPNALRLGVSYELFWNLNLHTLEPFIRAFTLQQEYDDMLAWRSGDYIRMAIASCFDKNTKYPSTPLSRQQVVDEKTQQDIIKSRFIRDMKLRNQKFRKEDTNG